MPHYIRNYNLGVANYSREISISETVLSVLYIRCYLATTMRQQTVIVLALFVAAVTVTGAASYTQASVDRDANIQVETDSAALVGLSVGGGITYDSVQKVDEKLVLNLDDGTGVNGNATYHYGADGTDTARDRGNAAFNVTNNDDNSRDFTFSYDQTSATDGNQNVVFDVYTHNSTSGSLESVGTVDEESLTASQTLGSTETLYVFVTVDTANLNSTDDLSGTFTIKAS